jgi:hypothetical protein
MKRTPTACRFSKASSDRSIVIFPDGRSLYWLSNILISKDPFHGSTMTLLVLMDETKADLQGITSGERSKKHLRPSCAQKM